MEPEQGNGKSYRPTDHEVVLDYSQILIVTPENSPLPYHFSAAARCRPEQGGTANVHLGTSIYVGADHKVRMAVL